MALKDPEIAGAWGALDDAAFADGDPASAHVLRELARQSNRLLAKPGLMYRWSAQVNGATPSEVAGSASLFAHAGPQYAIPIPSVPALKKPGLTKMRVSVNALIDTGASIYFGVKTLARDINQEPLTSWMKLTDGSGSRAQTTQSDIPVWPEMGEILSFYIKTVLNPDADTKMVELTYGSNNSGTVTLAEPDGWKDSTSTWSTVTPADEGGHYVVFRDDTGAGGSGNTIIHGPAKITKVISATNMKFWPPIADYRHANAQYDIYKLPSVRIYDIACYSQARTVLG